MPSSKNLDVRRVKSSLVASFGKAKPPLVWRLDLDRNHSFTLALQDHDGEWELGTTSPKGEFHSVARFPQKEDAEEAMQCVGEVLAEGRFGWLMGFLRNLGIGLLILFILLWGWSILAQRSAPQPQIQTMQQMPPMTTPAEEPPPPPPETPASSTPNGIPLPADEVLKPPAN